MRTVAIVVVTHNQAHYLADALASATTQTHPADEVLVVDDGSADHPETVVARFPGVRLVRQDNLMLAAARNTGIRETTAEHLVFLDADDRLLPRALEAGLECFARAPASGFVFGAYTFIDAAGKQFGSVHVGHVEGDAYQSFLERNCVNMHATALFRRDAIDRVGGFDPTLRRCEDYDLYLRITQHYPVACHSELTAEYRRHDSNMSLDYAGMQKSVLEVMERQRSRAAQRPEWQAAWTRGVSRWRDATCGMAMSVGVSALKRGRISAAFEAFRFVARSSPMAVPRGLRRRAVKRIRRSGYAGMFKAVDRFLHGRPLGPIWMGALGSTRPVDAHFGFGRGTPVDRHYIATFLDAHRGDIRGRVLEIGDNSYTRRFGSGVTKSDVLHVHAGNPYATITGDLSQPGVLPEAAFDCAVITQTLHCVFDIGAAVRQLRDSLKPGGVALVTLPLISQIDRGEWGEGWYWGIAPAGAKKLFQDAFGGDVTIEVFGNVYAATAFLQGLALEEVNRRKLMVRDTAYPVLVAVRAVRVDG